MTETTEQPRAGTLVATRLRNGAKALSEIRSQLEEAVEGMADLNSTCRDYKSIKDAYEWLDKERKAVYALMERVSREIIPNLLEENDVTNITLDFGEGLRYRFGKNQRLSASILDKETGFEWLRANGGGDLIQPTVNASALSTFAKEYVATKGADLPDDIFKVGTMVVTSVTKA